ncbi:hypothetical protein E4N62_40130 [Streptomyces sp. MNU76]|uniref:hypothetical protein n=1 Tax=Streptomyces sp. MNU76 TaxID=2560026 RepID=UPI001E3327CC|nr:hypothetical protein [Streptomyces sp. MNU76]MCC9710901.1 hypothetical protein [Streptomyces sp. MNU76]
MNRDLRSNLRGDTSPGLRRDLHRDLYAVAGAALLVLTAALVGVAIKRSKDVLHVGWPPLYANWLPHLGPGTPAALTVAVVVVAYGPAVAARLPWRALLLASWATATTWTFSLALIDGWHRGIARRLTTRYEYLQVIDRFNDIPATLRDFTNHILLHSPDHWPPHIAGHPPAATLTFVYLDRIGLGGGAWAGVWVITVGATTAVAVLVTARALADEALARQAAPFLVLAPAAVWMGTSADGYFAAVAAWFVALVALAGTARTKRRSWTAAFSAGLLFGLVCYLSYGLTLFAVIGAGVLVLGRRRLRALPILFAGTAVVPLAFTFVGFDWWEAYHLLVERYYQGAGGFRPYGYWVWANLACTVLVVGPATVAGLRRIAAVLVRERERLRPIRARARSLPVHNTPRHTPELRLALLVLLALVALLVADLSGMSKAETERIWLPFAVWLLAAGALLPRPRAWLAAQAALALLVNHLLLTGW